MVFKLGLK